VGGNVRGLLRWKFLALLLALILLLVVHPLLRDHFGARLLEEVLLATVFLAALLSVYPKGHRLVAVVLGVPTLVGLWSGYVLPGLPRPPMAVAFHAAATLFLVFTVATILRGVYQEEQVTADGISGALCAYLLVGLAFGHVYCIIETTIPGSFRATDEILEQLRDEGRVHFQLTYFSFATLTTVGYGDLAPAKGGARALAVFEAVVGQFYLAVLVGALIGKRVSQVLAERQAGAKAKSP
jgi:hypothetical protein